jgi:hypothetical protein
VTDLDGGALQIGRYLAAPFQYGEKAFWAAVGRHE